LNRLLLVSINMSKCPSDGNVGFPVIPAGQINMATAPQAQAFSMKLAASPTTVGRAIDRANGFVNDNGMVGTTFYFGSNPYTLAAIQVASPHNKNYIINTTDVGTGSVIADVVFYFELMAGNYVGNKALTYIIPLVNAAAAGTSTAAKVSTDIDAYLADALNAAAETPRVKSVEPFFTLAGRRILYSTCLNMAVAGTNTLAPTMTIQVIISPPAFLATANATAISNMVVGVGGRSSIQYMWPANIPRVGGEFPTLAEGQTVLASNNRSLEQLNYSLTESPVERFMGNGGGIEYVRGPEDLRTTQQYKCMPLDELKDVSGNMVLLDPASGTRTLADELAGREDSRADDLGGTVAPTGMVSSSTKSSAIKIAAIIIGVLIGFGVIGAIAWWFFKRSGGGGGGEVPGSNTPTNSPDQGGVDGGLGDATRGLAALGAAAVAAQQTRASTIATRRAALEAQRPGATPPAAPVNTTAALVNPPVAPVNPPIAPVNTTAAPVNTTAAPVNTTAAPVNPQVVPLAPLEFPNVPNTPVRIPVTENRVPELVPA
jgi:hypothetical protein